MVNGERLMVWAGGPVKKNKAVNYVYFCMPLFPTTAYSFAYIVYGFYMFSPIVLIQAGGNYRSNISFPYGLKHCLGF